MHWIGGLGDRVLMLGLPLDHLDDRGREGWLAAAALTTRSLALALDGRAACTRFVRRGGRDR